MSTKDDSAASESLQTKRRLIVLTGPTAAGKGTVEGILREKHPHIWLSVSATTVSYTHLTLPTKRIV